MSGHNYKQNYLVALVMMVFFAIVGVYSMGFKGTSNVFPVFSCTMGIICGIALIIETFIKQRRHEKVFEAKPTSKEAAKKTLLIFAALFLYALGVANIGFAVATLAFLLVISIYFSETKDKKTILTLVIVDVILVVVIYVLFAILMKVTLPHKLLI